MKVYLRRSKLLEAGVLAVVILFLLTFSYQPSLFGGFCFADFDSENTKTVTPLKVIDNAEMQRAAEELESLGLFKGTEKGFELLRSATRAEMLVMLLRLIGEEKNASECRLSHPFTDGGWADSYIAYAYNKGIINGVSETLFGSTQNASPKQFCTLLLRAMGYSDSEEKDFSYVSAVTAAECVLLCNINDETLLRGDMAVLSRKALNSKVKYADAVGSGGMPPTLGRYLAEKEVFSAGKFASLGEKYASTTVLIYMIASDLESERSLATSDITEMLAADSNERVRILLQSGGTKTWHNDFLTGGAVERSEIKTGKFSRLEALDIPNMCGSQTLYEFLKWGSGYAPAERYILIFWDHGMGPNGGFGRDETSENPEKAALSLSDIQDALTKSGLHFSAVGFDACLMGSAETAYALRDVADYLIASEDITAYEGWYYKTFLNTLARNPEVDTLSIAKIISDTHILRSDSLTSTVSVIKLCGAEFLFRNLNRIFEQYPNLLYEASRTTIPLGGYSGGYGQYDLMTLLETQSAFTKYALLAADSMTVYLRNGALQNGCRGMGIHVEDKRDK